MIGPTRERWLEQHPYLQQVADLHAVVDLAADRISIPLAPAPNWEQYIDEFHRGVPLLQSLGGAIDLSPAEMALEALVRDLAMSSGLPPTVAEEQRGLHAELRADPDARRRAVSWLLDGSAFAPQHPGLLQYLGWTVVARYLSDVVCAFAAWRDEERWLRRYCPACGAPPAMAQLVGADPGRLRLLSCGRCRSRWRYRRTGCPFCETGDDHRLAALAVEGLGDLRIDYCETCRGYLKTYVGEGRESVFLADWTSLHLDVIARARGLNRRAASLYEL
jgi:FdhE protein